ncbi:hypothetical protein C0J52_20517 [Blattella germanica]|nr:hypothetical protein C0J52_20517 [Blattella germanica]
MKILSVVALVALATVSEAGVAPLALPYAAIAPFGSSYTAHSINHALAAPVAVPAAAPLVAAPAPAVYAPHVAAPAFYAPHAAYIG